ncbi:MAG TPA: protein kinase [Gemmatimonadales bacterium]|nr:protein kinase [Gemmatimonadales bacterium]
MAELRERLQRALGATYVVERELPGGGLSRVFLATDVQLARPVVVKVLPPEMTALVQAERFTREIQVAASLQHPHIVPLLSAGSGDALAWYVMPFIEGESLATRVAREGALPVNEALKILVEVVDALAYSHAHGVVHRDIKPDNVMLSGRHAMVTDFGVAKAVSASSGARAPLTTGGVALGTPAYMAPEQATADPAVDHRADLYAVGVMAYELFAGRTPFTAQTPHHMLSAHVTAFPDPVTLFRPSLPPAVAAAVMRCLEKLPADRYQSAEELSSVLEAAITPSGGLTPVPLSSPGMSFAGAEAQEVRAPEPLAVAELFLFVSLTVVATVFGATRIFGLPDWVWVVSAVVMVLGFPVVMYTARVERKRARALGPAPVEYRPKGHHGWFTWRSSIWGGVLALGVLAVAAIGYTAARTLGIGPAGTLLSSGVMQRDDRFVLADFQNRTDDSTLGTSVTEALRVDLGQSRVVRILSEREVATGLTRMTLKSGMPLVDSIALQLARREGAKAVITGEVAPVGSGYVLTAQVVEASTGETKAAVRATAADDAHLLIALNELSAQLRERIGESLRSIRASEPLEMVTTRSLEALQHYSTGSRVFVQGDYDAARVHLEQAIADDSNFAMAWRKLGVVLFNTGAPRSQMVAAVRRAFELRDRLTPIEGHLTEAFYYDNVQPDRDRTITAYQAVLQIDPLEVTALNNLTLALNQMERFAEAEVVGRQGVGSVPTRSLYINLSDALTGQGKWRANDSLAELATTRLEIPGEVPAYMIMTAAERARDFGRLDSVLSSLPTTAPTRSEHETRVFFTSEWAMATGRHNAALAATDALAAEKATSGDLGYALDLALGHPFETVLFGNDPALARRQVAALLAKYPLERMSPGDRPYGTLGWIYARLGDAETVRRMRREYEAAVPPDEREPGLMAEWDEREGWARGEYRQAITANRAGRTLLHCAHCGLYREAELWDRLHNTDSVRAVLERAVTTMSFRDTPEDVTFYPPALKRLGELAEARGDRAAARGYYQRFVDLWRNADPLFQPQVADVKRRIAALGPDQPR